jgi:putative Mn2+ efflux pump MntP
MMPIIGWYLATGLDPYLRGYDHWVAFALLAFIGVKMINESVSVGPDNMTLNDPTRGWTLLMLSVAKSIDAPAVGLSMAFLRVEVWTPSIVIGFVAAVMTAFGLESVSR